MPAALAAAVQAAECCRSIRIWYSESKCCRFTQAKFFMPAALLRRLHNPTPVHECRPTATLNTLHIACLSAADTQAVTQPDTPPARKIAAAVYSPPNSIVSTDSTFVPMPGSIQQLASGVSTMGRHCTQQPTTAAEQGFEGMHHPRRDDAVAYPAQHAYSIVQAMQKQSIARQQHGGTQQMQPPLSGRRAAVARLSGPVR